MSAFGQNTSGTSGTASSTGSGLFGNTASGGTGGAPSLFGGSKPAGSIFGNLGSSTSGGLFSTGTGGNTTSSSPAPPAGGSLFGNSSTTANSSSPAPGGGLFGNSSSTPKPTTGGGLFGNTTTSSGPSAAGGLFGSTSSSTPLATAGGSSATTNNSTSAPGSGLFGGTSGSSVTNPLFGGLGSSSSTPSTQTQGTPNLFGGAPKPAEQSANSATQPATTSLFGNAPSTTTSSTLPGGSLFGHKPADSLNTASTPAAGTAAPGGGLLGGSLFGKKPDTPATGTTTTTSSTTAAPSLFSGLGSKDTTSGKSDTPATSSGGLFGTPAASKDKPEEKKDAPAAGSSINIFGTAAKDTSGEKKELGSGTSPANKDGEKKDVPALTTSALGPPSTSNSTSIAVPPPSMLRGKTIEEIVNRWSSELEGHVREFHKFAGEVAAWDRALIDNGNSLAALFSHVLAAEREQTNIDQALDHIEQQQKDLSAALDSYEKATEDILGGDNGSLRVLDTGPADSERDKNYVLATELHTHLDDLSSSLTQMIEAVNALSDTTPDGKPTKQEGEDPMTQIVEILSSHLESLQWIDGSVRELETKVGEVEQRIKDSGTNLATGLGGAKSRSFGLARSAY